MYTLEEQQVVEAAEKAKGCPDCKGEVDAFLCFNATLRRHVLRRCLVCLKMFDETGSVVSEVKA